MDCLLPQRLRSIRRAKDLTQQKLGQLAGLNYTTISRIESGDAKQVYADTVCVLARALGCTTDYLLGLRTEEEEAAIEEAHWWAAQKTEYRQLSLAELSARVEAIALAPTPPWKEG